MQSLGKMLVVFGGVLFVMGLIFMFGGKISWLGRLPGDIIIRREGFQFYFPVTTSILVSLIISALLYIIGRK
ncbi:MAG: DUF2905 domain-containing protein [Candidatus Omnitrophica bacterium]|nr:DUF2905 domain-containing protein [Candidatus Omnitrophota bacterium]